MGNPSAAEAERQPPAVSVIIVSWNVRDLLRACLLSLADRPAEFDLEVIVVDSGSADSSPEMVRREFSWARLIARSDNVGFARGSNIGLAAARGEYLLLLNPDTEIVGDALQQLVAYLEANRRVGVVGPQLLNTDGSLQSSRRRFPSFWTAVFDSAWLRPLAPPGLLVHYEAGDLPADQIADVDWLTGACLLVRRGALEQVGGLDEAFFMFSEELDWCRRMKMAGWRVVYVPAATVLHHQGKSSEQAVPERHLNFQRAKLRYFRKYHGRLATAGLRLVLLLVYGWQLLLEAAKGLLGHRRPLRWQRVRAYWRVLRSGLRPAGY